MLGSDASWNNGAYLHDGDVSTKSILTLYERALEYMRIISLLFIKKVK